MVNKKFLYFLTNEPKSGGDWLKAELLIHRPEFKFSYSRPGLITYVNSTEKPMNYVPIFSRHFGYSLFRGTKVEAVHHYELMRSKYPLIDCEKKLGEKYPEYPCFELVPVKENEYILGFLEKSFGNDWVLGDPHLTLPEHAPSRAYLKILEVEKTLNLKIAKEDNIIEFGSAPGGATLALLEKGAKVFGVDTGVMHELCLNHPNFISVKKSIQETNAEDFERDEKTIEVDWLLSDMNLSPFAVLGELKKFFERTKIKPTKGIVLTLKMTKKEMLKDLDQIEKKVFKMGFDIRFMGQLPGHNQEFALVAKTSKTR